MALDATFFALVGLILFFALLAYLKVPGMIGRSLDQRADNIRNELADAKRLRVELAQEMTRSEISRAQKMAREWLTRH